MTAETWHRSQFRIEPRPAPGRHPSVGSFYPTYHQAEKTDGGGSRWWGAPPWNSKYSPTDHIVGLVPELSDFILAARPLRLDGYVIELPRLPFGTNVPALASTTHAVLKLLSDHDPAVGRSLDGEVDSATWQFHFAGEPLVVTTFAAFYPADHPRKSMRPESTFLALQPNYAAGLPRRPLDELLPVAVRRRLWSGTANARGTTQPPFAASRIVRATRQEDRVVRWWETALAFS